MLTIKTLNENDDLVFEASVICEYSRPWDSQNFDIDRGRITDEIIDEICSSEQNLKFGYKDEFESEFCFEHMLEDSLPKWMKEFIISDGDRHIRFKNGYLVLRSQVNIPKEKYLHALKSSEGEPIPADHFSDETLRSVYKNFVVSTLCDFSFLFSIAANIAKPGSIQFRTRYLVHDQELIKKTGGTLNFFEEAFEISKKYSWPPIECLNFSVVWNWLVNVPGFTLGESKTPLGRAIAALSYLLNDDYKDEEQLALVWALIGLESLYCSGSLNLKQQLMERSEIFLGSRPTFKKQFGHIYDFRSRLVHGDKNMHYKNFDPDPGNVFTDTLTESESFAISTLISTLQKMSVNQLYELNFRTILQNNSSSP